MTETEEKELRRDKARLDWFADRENHIGNIMLPREAVEANPHSLRAAIDAAMKMEPPNEKTDLEFQKDRLEGLGRELSDLAGEMEYYAGMNLEKVRLARECQSLAEKLMMEASKIGHENSCAERQS